MRGFVYEAAGTAEPALLSDGADIVREASRTWHIPVEIVDTDPADAPGLARRDDGRGRAPAQLVTAGDAGLEVGAQGAGHDQR